MQALCLEGYGSADGVQEVALVDACQGEAALVESLRALGRGADADCRERAADAREEGAFLGQGAGVGDDAERRALQLVVVVEPHRLVGAHQGVQLEARGLQAFAGAGVAAVEDGLSVLLGQGVDGVEEALEVPLSVDILLAVGGEQEIAARLQPLALQHVGGVDSRQVRTQDLSHGRARHVGALGGAAGGEQIPAGVLGVGQVHVGDHVHDAAVRLLRQALVLAAVAGFHVEDRYVQALGRDGGEATVGVTQDQQGIRPHLRHQLVACVDDVANGAPQVVPHCVQVGVGVRQTQVAEEDAVQGVVVVLAGVGQEAVEVPPAELDNLREADDLRAGAHDYQKLDASVALEGHVGVVGSKHV